MALQNRDVDITEFIKFTAGGIRIADFSQIQNALIRRYQSVYGSDIDLSTASADGVYIYNLSLIINNILQSYKTLYSNLDVNTASGVYLDTLCRLSNVKRKPATKSIAYLTLTATEATTLTTGTIFIDHAKEEWTYNGPNVIFANGETKSGIAVTCSRYGEVIAKANSIFQTLEVSSFTVSQPNDAVVGMNEENDNDLRFRRAQSSGASGASVLESLIGSLLSIIDIRDVKVYNNNTGSTDSTSTQDETEIPPHSVYIILRKNPNASVTDDEIGQLIYQKLTPGIATTQSAVTGDRGSSTFYPSLGPNQIYDISQTVYWKNASPITPEISIELTAFDSFDYDPDTEIGETPQLIADAVRTYLNNLPIGTTPSSTDLLIEAMTADPTFKGRPTFVVTQVTIDGTNTDTWFNYDFSAPTVDSQHAPVYTITFGGS